MKLKELFEMSQAELVTAEHIIEKLFKSLKLDVVWTTHFKERVTDREESVSRAELTQAFKKLQRKYSKRLKDARDHKEEFVAVLKDLSSNLNIPFVIDFDKTNNQEKYVMRGITIMRKNPNDFKINAKGGEELKV